MNRFFILIPGIVLASVLVYQNSLLGKARGSNERLQADLKATQNQMVSTQENVSFLKKSLELAQTHNVELKRSLLEWEAKPEPLQPSATPVNGECWPAGKAWCYLPKADLPHFEYATILPDGKVSEEAVALYGMSPEERSSVEAAYTKFNDELFKLDVAYLQPAPTPDFVKRDKTDMKSTTYKLAVPVEKSKEIYTHFEESIQHILSGKRASLFLEAESRHLSYWFQEIKYPVLNLTFFTEPKSARRWTMKCSMLVDNPTTGIGKYYYPVDETAEGFARYTHLLDRYLLEEH